MTDIGSISPISLANFDIKYPVFNAGFGIERMAMIIDEATDIRKLSFPQFSIAEFADDEIAKSLSYIEEPQTERGKAIAKAIEDTARTHKDDVTPADVEAYADDKVRVTIVKEEADKKLSAPPDSMRLMLAMAPFSATWSLPVSPPTSITCAGSLWVRQRR